MARRHGRLIRQHHEAIEIEFSTSPSIGFEPACLELFGVPTPLDHEEMIVVEEAERCLYMCRVVDQTSVCSVVEVRDWSPFGGGGCAEPDAGS